jgi:hypothetical protein
MSEKLNFEPIDNYDCSSFYSSLRTRGCTWSEKCNWEARGMSSITITPYTVGFIDWILKRKSYCKSTECKCSGYLKTNKPDSEIEEQWFGCR